jgi:6-phosphogluconolactonase
MMNYESIGSKSVEQGIALIASELVELINNELAKNNAVNLLMRGGNTPKKLYETLLQTHRDDIDWCCCRLIILDERWAPFESERSNAGECYRHFASQVPLKAFIYPDTSLSIEDSLSDFSQSIKSIESEGILAAILGTANDGHIASIFPSMTIIAEAEDCFACAVDNTDEKRVSLTLDYINRSNNIWMMAFGDNKRDIIEMASSVETSDLPALNLNPDCHPKWFTC